MGCQIVVIINVDWIYDLEWIDQMTQLWPFDSEDLTLIFSPSATADLNDHEDAIFHFITG